MSFAPRIALLALAWICLLPGVVKIATALPPFGAPTEIYGQTVNELGPKLRRVSNMVSAVNFDFRGFDTLGEEFMLVCAVTGTVLLLRGARGEEMSARPERVDDRPILPRAESTILISRLFGPLTLLFGIYMALHATVTPGGGFQGGVVIASALLLVYLGEGYENWRKLIRSPVLAMVEGGGALVFVVAGLAPMLAGAAFMQNVLPLGTFHDVFSGGLMLVENAGVAFAVSGGFAMLFVEFMEETRAEKSARKS